jgi:putative transposase
MARGTSMASFICELPLILSGDDERVLVIRLDCARQVYNAVLGESLRRLALLRQAKAYQEARALPRRTKEERKARAAAFRALDERFGLREYDLHAWAGQFTQSWLGQHLDANTIQTIATRAFDAVRQHQFGKRGRPRYKGKGQLLSVEGKSNKQGIRWREGRVLWGPLTLPARLPADDPVVAHALASRVKFVRLIRRVLNGRARFFVQLVCAGQPYRKAKKHPVGAGVVGIDPGPRTFGLAGADWGAQVDLAAPFAGEKRTQCRLQRKLDRQRRANNPTNYLPDGRAKPGRKRWCRSRNQRDTERRLSETLRREAAHRTTLQGQLANAVLRLGDDIRIERNSYRSFQRTYGKAVGQAAPATFVTLLTRKAASADASLTVIPTSLRLSQTCLCGTIARKSLSERVHRCECGITVQRDVWSAYLARFSQATVGPNGPLWHLDAEGARQAFSGTESCLPAVSSPVSVQAFAAFACDHQPASVAPSGGGHLPDGRSERVVGEVATMVREGSDAVPPGVSAPDARAKQSASGRHQNPRR